ncbi:uncharacterized protein VTP21DRAFT_8785 [Calcarisporiella thermophila]|uniref:uncharacterized protein n=1 Tax=Calcarisporiella thermophila TaxID=911321 RepID=UPI00374444D6
MNSIQEGANLPFNVRPIHYSLKLIPNFTDFSFVGEEIVEIEIHQDTTEIALNACDLEVTAATVTNLAIKTYQSQDVSQIIHEQDRQVVKLRLVQALPSSSKANVKLAFAGKINDQMRGFYRSSYKDADEKVRYMASTQFEATDARRAFPCWDEPALKATFDIVLVVDAHMTALSNMNILSEVSIGDCQKEVCFARTPVMSTYLVAFIVGELEYIETTTTGEPNGGQPVLCRVYTPPGLKEHGQFALDIGCKALEIFAQTFGTPYPLPKYDQVAIPDFESGAMENWGLVTYRTNLLLYDESTSDARQKQYIASVICHETAHQWFGNLVTMTWWNELWLNEGFATWAGWFAVDRIFPDWDIWTQFIMDVMQNGLQLDAMRASHAIDVPVSTAAEINQIFDMISYAKGASVIRMLSEWMGIDCFLDGVRRYLRSHAYRNATTEDLWRALSEEFDVDVGSFMSQWTRQVGYPVLKVIEHEGGEVSIQQHRYLLTGDVQAEEDRILWWVPLNIAVGGTYNKKEWTKHSTILMERSVRLRGLPVKGSVERYFKLNHDHTGFYRVLYTSNLLARLGMAVQLGEIESTRERVGLLADAGALVMSGHMRTSDLLSLILCYEKETEYIVWKEITGRLSTLSRVLFEEPEQVRKSLRGFQHQLYSSLARRLGWDYLEEEDYLTTLLRTLMLRSAGHANVSDVVAEAKRRFDRFVNEKDETALHPNVRAVAYEIVVAHGGEREFGAVLKIFNEAPLADQKVAALQALGYTKQPELIRRLLELTVQGSQVKVQDIHHVYVALSTSCPQSRALLWEFVQQKWHLLLGRYNHSMKLLGYVVKIATSSFTTEAKAKEIEEFFSKKDTREYSRHLAQSIEMVRVGARWSDRDRDDIVEWLRERRFMA